MGDGGSAGHEDNKGSLAANEVDEQLEESVDGEGLDWSVCADQGDSDLGTS